MVKTRVSMGKEGDLRDSKYGVVFGAREAGWSISEADLLPHNHL